MHIVFLTNEFPTSGQPHGGVGTFVKFMAERLVEAGISISVVGFYKGTTISGEVSQEEGVLVYRLPSSRWRFFRFADHAFRVNQKLKAINRNHKIDVVEAPELGLSFIRKLKGVKYVIRMHGGHHFFAQAENRKISAWRGFQERRSFDRADALVGVSRYVVNHTAKYLKFDPTTTPVIFNPVNLAKFHRANPAKIIKGRIVFVGTVCEKKGIRQLVMAMPRILKVVPEAHLMIAGRDWFFPSGLSYIQYLQDFIDPAVKDSITFLGTVPNTEVPQWIESAEICAYPSHMEAMPLAWLEGLAMGKAVVASQTGPGPEVIQNGVTGVLCDPYSHDDIASRILTILTDSTFRDSLSEQAYNDIHARFDSQMIVNQNIEFYSDIV